MNNTAWFIAIVAGFTVGALIILGLSCLVSEIIARSREPVQIFDRFS
jgi:hypothetical protein